jgi:hypothetical protein
MKSAGNAYALRLPRRASENLERKNTPCIFDLAGVDFFLKKERVFFFLGSVRKDIRTGGVQMQFGLGFAKLFFGERIRKTETNLFRGIWIGFPRGGGVWGGIRAGSLLGFWRGGLWIKKTETAKIYLSYYNNIDVATGG